jgi:DNA-binding FadR family transcriptional regulator
VTSLESDLLMETMGLVVDLQRDADSVLNLFEVRRALEPFAAARAAVRMPRADIDGLFDLLDQLGEHPDIESLVSNDIEFHHRIAQGSGNPVLSSLIDGLSGRTQRARVWRGLTQQDAVARTLVEHRSIATAIAGRQPELAHARSATHIADVEAWIRQSFAEPA